MTWQLRHQRMTARETGIYHNSLVCRTAEDFHRLERERERAERISKWEREASMRAKEETK